MPRPPARAQVVGEECAAGSAQGLPMQGFESGMWVRRFARALVSSRARFSESSRGFAGIAFRNPPPLPQGPLASDRPGRRWAG